MALFPRSSDIRTFEEQRHWGGVFVVIKSTQMFRKRVKAAGFDPNAPALRVGKL